MNAVGNAFLAGCSAVPATSCFFANDTRGLALAGFFAVTNALLAVLAAVR